MGFRLGPAKRLRVLDFDIENRPLSYLGMDFTTSDITAIAAGFEGERKVHAWFLGEVETEVMLANFLELYDKADIVTGHYIRFHDLPIISGAMVELGWGALPKKLASDTKVDLLTFKGISKSQEALSAMYELKMPKQHMTQSDWRKANRLTPDGIEQARRRVRGDIRQHRELRQRLLADGLLKPPSIWTPRKG
jgi:hypothetical protein